MEIPPLPGGVTAPGGKVDVFISFIHEEQQVAETVQEFIEEVLHMNIFVSCDKWAIFAGDQWLERIKKALETAKVIVLLLSAESVARPWVNFEAGAAWLQGTALLPVCFKDLKPGDLPKPYSSFTAIDLCGGMGDQYYLIASIAHHLGIPPPICGEPPEAYNRLRASVCALCLPK